ncbi:uncharacterized protein LOC133031277 [Cannabis sativa]|uniref:uncharacterized protein LOC133031277 n=1 Tax=Cannabis sativa TaxID=3483 RepID=UPI0029C9CF37|nr:uncharacterized protein LOC133031277 [Cannabis sativa]
MSWDRLATPKEECGMGFRHLHDFNLAMLAKQGWQLLCKPDSFAGRVYKAKYFPNSDFISFDLGNNPSFVWRSIWGAKDLVRLGAARVIGDGRNTRIMGTPWLPSTSNKYVSSTHPGLSTHTISSLFQPNMICWDADVVRDLFSPQEANLILGIPLSNTGRPDFVWNKCNSTVKEVLATSSITLEHWRKAQDKSALLSLSFNNSDDGAELWTLPATNNLKINVDAALFRQDNSYDYGLVARDHFGKFLEAKTCHYNGNYPAEVVEALGIKEALSWIKNKAWNNAELDSDSLLSVQAIKNNQKMSSTFGIIIDDCRLLLSLLKDVKLRFVKRSANRVAHAIARHSQFIPGGCILEQGI